ncbi:MAG: hypothetical protein PHD74_05130 [Candidatus Krumholzibacteria bacterium]|nr:hypothetical protein [Candidatus Krumholzibacteria bacterium]
MRSEKWMRGGSCIIKLGRSSSIGLVILLAMLCSNGCEKEDTLAPNISISGTVTDNSGYAGTIIVEIDYNRRDIANSAGQYSIAIHTDFYVDSLYAWVDRDGNSAYTAGEPFGFYHSSTELDRAKSIHARDSDIGNINFSIP